MNAHALSLEQRIYTEIFGLLDENIHQDECLFLANQLFSKTLQIIVQDIIEDLLALCKKDPASANYMHFNVQEHRSFLAIMHYRLAHRLYHFNALNINVRQSIAKRISESAKLRTGVEIHPAAKIGKRLVIDHGIGTVIGETTTIGTDCYILSNVILGARGIGTNRNEKRHPTIGNNVQIGGFVRVLGPVVIGNNVFLAPHCVITDDVPDDVKVVILNQLQLSSKTNARKLDIYGVSSSGIHALKIYGHFYDRAIVVTIVDRYCQPIDGLNVKMLSTSNTCVVIRLDCSSTFNMSKDDCKHVKLKISTNHESVFVITNKVLRKIVVGLQQR